MKYRGLVLSGKEKTSVEMIEAKPLEPGWVRVKLAAGGICGSDQHYYRDYGNTGFPLKNPVVMGHEASGTIAEIGAGVEGLKEGDKVAVNPVLNCGFCPACRRGEANNCQRKRFPGSAMNYPHIDGFFSEYFSTRATNCIKVPDTTDLTRLAFAEPFACTLHAVMKAGNLSGRKVLVTGAGPIGVLAAAAARIGGAAQVAITDITDGPLEVAKKLGADIALNTKNTPVESMFPFDVSVEASGSFAAATTCMKALRKGGTMIQLGNVPAVDTPMPWILFLSMEIRVLGSNQFNTEFDLAVALLMNNRIDPLPLLSKQFTFDQAAEAFDFARDRNRCMKAQFIP